jgi:hypothetical protein
MDGVLLPFESGDGSSEGVEIGESKEEDDGSGDAMEETGSAE